MIVVMKNAASQQQVDRVIELLENQRMQVVVNRGVEVMVLGVLGDTAHIDREAFSMLPGVDRVVRVQEPYKKAGRKFHPEDTRIKVGDAEIGGAALVVIAGPCSVEGVRQISDIAASVKASGAQLLRGGAYKPRSSPYAFQGLEKEGLEMLRAARAETGLPIVTEIMTPRLVELFDSTVDVIQIGARNMQNYDLLKEVGHTGKPILLKRGLSSTVEEWLMSAEYIMAHGNPNVILCERGIRTFETATRNTLDVSAIPLAKKLSHLPVIVDPSHASGHAWMVPSLAMAAVAVGADGLIIEVHNDPAHALCDGPQSVTPDQFDALMKAVSSLRAAMAAIGGRG